MEKKRSREDERSVHIWEKGKRGREKRKGGGGGGGKRKG